MDGFLVKQKAADPLRFPDLSLAVIKLLGAGEAVLDSVRTVISAGFAVLVPAGASHNIINTGSVPLKLYTLYAPPNHRDSVIHHTLAEAQADNEHFDGKTTEWKSD